jgi:YD repeat-containing protein
VTHIRITLKRENYYLLLIKTEIMRIRILTVCLFFVTIFLSCKKEDLSDAAGPAGSNIVPVLSKVMIDNSSAAEYLYNDAGLLWEEKCKFDLTMNSYNAAGQLVSSKYYGNDDVLSSDAAVSDKALAATAWVTLASGKEGGTVTYTYNDNGQLTKTTTTRPSLTTSEYSEFTYNSNNKINKQTMFWESVATGYIDYVYDSKGNLTSETLYNLPATGTAELITITNYTYDDKLNPFKLSNKLQIPGINTNTNNILKETYTIHAAQGSDKVVVSENTYKYNSLGYPTSQNANITFVY